MLDPVILNFSLALLEKNWHNKIYTPKNIKMKGQNFITRPTKLKSTKVPIKNMIPKKISVNPKVIDPTFH